MVYIFNTYFKDDTFVHLGLVRCMGIGKRMATQICDQLGFSKEIRYNQLTVSQYNLLREILHQNYYIGNALQQLIRARKKRLSSISAYRGFRHLRGLPCRGQRTHGNARTSRKQIL